MTKLDRWLGLLAAILVLAGCASTRHALTGQPMARPICEALSGGEPARFYWQANWRSDQKEPALREAAAARGIQRFIEATPCLRTVPLEQLASSAGKPATMAELTAHHPATTRLLLTVRELGPRLSIGLPVIVEGETQVVLELKVMSGTTLVADTAIDWRNGGPFVIKGVKTLDQDMAAALAQLLMPPEGGRP